MPMNFFTVTDFRTASKRVWESPSAPAFLLHFPDSFCVRQFRGRSVAARFLPIRKPRMMPCDDIRDQARDRNTFWYSKKGVYRAV